MLVGPCPAFVAVTTAPRPAATRSASRAMCYKCYMEATSPRRGKKNQVGIREMRQNLSVYLRRVQKGETLEVLDRGRPVALLTPLPTPGSILDRLVAEGRASAPTGDLLELGPPGGKPSRTLSEALQSVREDRA